MNENESCFNCGQGPVVARGMCWRCYVGSLHLESEEKERVLLELRAKVNEGVDAQQSISLEIDRLSEEESKRVAELTALQGNVDELQADRSAAVRHLAAGDESQRRVISEIETKLSPLTLRLEGLTILLFEVKEALKNAHEELETEQDAENARLSAFISVRFAEEQARVKVSLPDRVQRICKLHGDIGIEIGALMIDLASFPDLQTDLEGVLLSLPTVVYESVRDRGLKPVQMPGPSDQIKNWPLVDGEMSAHFPGVDFLDANEVSRVRHNSWLEVQKTEFKGR